MLRRNLTCFKHLPYIFITIIFFVVINLSNNKFVKPVFEKSVQETKITFNTTILEIFTLGNRKLVSSFLWIKTLLESDIKHVEGDQLSWMYYRFKSISQLDPHFYENYLYGGIYLSIIKDDLNGAADIFEKGLLKFPGDYQLLYHSAFNYHFEMGNTKKALEKYNELLKHPWSKNFKILPRLVARLSSSENNSTMAFNLLYRSFTQMKEGLIKDRTANALYELKAEIDLDCLNSKSLNCSQTDFDGNRYILKNGGYQAIKKWRKINKKKER